MKPSYILNVYRLVVNASNCMENHYNMNLEPYRRTYYCLYPAGLKFLLLVVDNYCDGKHAAALK